MQLHKTTQSPHPMTSSSAFHQMGKKAAARQANAAGTKKSVAAKNCCCYSEICHCPVCES
jgi:hypothetical protein